VVKTPACREVGRGDADVEVRVMMSSHKKLGMLSARGARIAPFDYPR
jgi:hypothetical protein